jgi:preprotein translocase subunit SecB
MAEEKPAEKRLSIGKIYLKDFSFESPQAPDVFRQSDWKPQTDLNLRSSHTKIDATKAMSLVQLSVASARISCSLTRAKQSRR